MSADNTTRPGREVAYRLFAAEFDDATLSYAESDEERAPNYVISPTGARLNRVFAVGTLTEVSAVNEEMVRARIVDPTGAFVVYAGQYQPEALAFLERTEPPAFVAVTGKARTFEPDDGDRVYTSIRPETLATVDADTRDRWIVGTAERTRERIATYAAAAELDIHGEELTEALLANDVPRSLAIGVPLAQDHYGTTPGYLDALDDLALDAVRVVAGDRSQVDPFQYTPSDVAREGVSFESIAAAAECSYTVPDDLQSDTESESEEGRPTSDVSAGAAIGTATAETTAVDDEGPATETATPDQPTDESAATEASKGAGVESGGGRDDDPAQIDAASTDHPDDAGDTASADETRADADVEEQTDESAVAEPDPEPETDDELGDFDSSGIDEGLYDMDDEEREAVEDEYGTEFTTGTEVDEPGEADIEVPEPESANEAVDSDAQSGDTAEDGSTDGDRTDDGDSTGDDVAVADEASVADEESTVDDGSAPVDDESTETPDDEANEKAGDDPTETAGDDSTETTDAVDLTDAVIEAMADLDEGDGADRTAVVDAVTDETGASADDVESAIQDALMGGECYEPDDETLKAI